MMQDVCGLHLWKDLPLKDGGCRQPKTVLEKLDDGHTNCLRLRRRFVINLRVRRVAPSSAWNN